MNKSIQDFENEIKDKKVAVIGIGISNTPLIKYLSSKGAKITAFDKNEYPSIKERCEELKAFVEEFSLGNNYLSNLKGFDYIFRTPGLRFDTKELADAAETGSIITSEMELFLSLCPCKTIGITGSDGKTTTTTLIYSFLKEAGYKCWVGGNIGTPLLDRIEEMSKEDIVVVELSSFQLHTFKISPDIAVITNITPNHLDYHKSYEEYIDAKTNIFKYQQKESKLVINYDNEITREFKKMAKGQVVYFSRVNKIDEGFTLEDGYIASLRGGVTKSVLDISCIKVPGIHNIENFMTAAAAVEGLVSEEDIKRVAETFNGVEHRIELVRELNGIKFYNSSIDSSPNRTIATLNSFDQKLILIAGGKDKNIPFDDLGDILIKKVKILLLIGPTAKKIEESLKSAVEKSSEQINIPILHCETYDEIVKKAYENASKGDIILLSPASTSFDMFRNFEERGRLFKQIVNSL